MALMSDFSSISGFFLQKIFPTEFSYKNNKPRKRQNWKFVRSIVKVYFTQNTFFFFFLNTQKNL